ncbi:MAG: DUF4215 domain-containing protein, partial [Myxococcales bacterium]|nr:DUF4215 domain-containing protein [Myxococcales bacterium]
MYTRASRALCFGGAKSAAFVLLLLFHGAGCAKSQDPGPVESMFDDASRRNVGGFPGAGDATVASDDAPPPIDLPDGAEPEASTPGCGAADCGADAPPPPPPTCGDGVIQPGEQCDDGNVASGDGCSAYCQIESGYTCPSPGHACVPIQTCGNGRIDGSETCDDGNTVGGDGCNAACQVEPGWRCPIPGSKCIAAR